jgi:hypothetical protein
MNLLVGRGNPGAAGFGIQANGAHGVTRPTPTSRFRGSMREFSFRGILSPPNGESAGMGGVIFLFVFNPIFIRI